MLGKGNEISKVIFFISLIILICCGIYFVFDKDSAPSDFVADKQTMEEVKEIYDKISETGLMEKIINELKEKGYSPQGGGAYTIFSADKQMLTLLMYDIDLNNKVMT